jgi:hypothetical protein
MREWQKDRSYNIRYGNVYWIYLIQNTVGRLVAVNTAMTVHVL